MKRELCKFLAGVVAGLAFVHVAYAVALPRGIINQPVWRGRKWKLEYIWAEAATYSVVSLALAYFGWFAKPQPLQEPRASAIGHSKQGADQDLVSTPKVRSGPESSSDWREPRSSAARSCSSAGTAKPRRRNCRSSAAMNKPSPVGGTQTWTATTGFGSNRTAPAVSSCSISRWGQSTAVPLIANTLSFRCPRSTRVPSATF